MSRISKRDIIALIMKYEGCTYDEARHIYELFVDIITDEILAGNQVILNGFGYFTIAKHKGHKACFDGEKTIDDYNVLKFHSSNIIRGRLNGKENK